MTNEYQTGRPSSSEGSAKDAARDTAQTAKEDASGVAKSAAESGQHLAEEAMHQARQVTQEVKDQAQDLFLNGLLQASQQAASSQQEKLAGGLRSLSNDLRSIAEGEAPEQGLATDVARQISTRVESVADWFENREPKELVGEVRRFASRRPGTFLAIAAGTGLLVGRLTRGAKDAQEGEQQGEQGGGSRGGAPTRTSAYGAGSAPTTSTYGTGPTYGETTSTGTGAAYAAGLAGTSGGSPTSGVDVGTGAQGTGAYGSDPYATSTTDTGTTTPGYGTDRVQDTYGAGTQDPPSGAGTFTTDTPGYGTPGDEDAGVFGGGTGEVPEREAGTTGNPWSPVRGEEGQR